MPASFARPPEEGGDRVEPDASRSARAGKGT